MLAPDTILQSRYRIERKLGSGGMGDVYLAIDQRFDSEVALKESHFTDEAARRQFEREARLLNRLRHNAMTRVIDHFTESDGQFLVMDYVKGEDLWAMIQKRKGAFPLDKVLEWADQLLDALSYLHKQDPPIIHRDIKPHNLKLSDTGQIILLDFGLAKGALGQTSSIMTSRSVFGYTPVYAPLEQIHGSGTDPKSDLYSLGATLYHLITGIIPADAPTRYNAIEEGRADPLRSAREVNPEVTDEISAVLMRALAVSRRDRWPSAVEMREALNQAKQVLAKKSSELKETVLPPTIIDTAPAVIKEEQAVRPLPPTVAGPPPRGKQQEPISTIAADTLASPTTAEASSPRLTARTEPFQPFTAHGLPAKKSKRLLPLIGGAAALLIIIAVAVIVYKNSSNETSVSSVASNKPDPALMRLLPESIQKSGELRIGTDATYPPFESAEGGQFTGFDIDLGNALARELGVRARFVNTSFDGIFPALQNGSFDMVLSSVTITPERSASMLFSDPYIESGQAIVVHQDTPDIETLDNLRNKRVGVQINTTAQFEIEKRAGVQLAKYNTIDLALLDLRNKRIDAVVCDAPVARHMILQSFRELKITGRPFAPEKWGIAMTLNSRDLQRAVNAALKRIKDSGEYDRIYEKWFGTIQTDSQSNIGENDDPIVAGSAFYTSLGCISCHGDKGQGGRGPDLRGLFGNTVRLQGGQEVSADENYIKESILDPRAKVLAGFQPIMPAYKGQITEEHLIQLIAYIKSLNPNGIGK